MREVGEARVREEEGEVWKGVQRKWIRRTVERCVKRGFWKGVKRRFCRRV